MDGATEVTAQISALHARVRLLVALQREIVKIALAGTEAQIVAQLLRSTCETLGYSRAIYFNVDRERGIEARVEIARGSDIRASYALANVQSGSPFCDALRDERPRGGTLASRVAPLRDVRGSYVLSPLRDETRTFGIVYADDASHALALQAEPSHVHALTAVAAAALGASALATLDPLTGLLNRRAIAERYSIELELCRRGARSLTYAIIDVDDLKFINDSRGHAQGDETLRGVAKSLLRSCRAGDVVGRSGGDEFVVILPGVDREAAGKLIARLSGALEEAGLRCSIGAAVFPQAAGDGADLALVADRALYATKAAGKNGLSFA